MWLEVTPSLLATLLGRNCSSFLLSNPVANSCLSRIYNVPVKNSVAWEEKNRWQSIVSVSARRCNFGHSCTLYNAFLAYF